ncbi:LPXTG cell wall anchor domain-containing protein, partial [Lactobacillus jensenii]|uniref:LPXTG cell wall anchor domain-containing protein n=2 Tax=Lactobacillus jensenii TaxID=109790 RepID=UPI0029C246C3
TAKTDAQNLNDAKKAAKDAIDKMEDLSDADKTAAKANVDKATDISGVDTAKTDAQNLNDAKKAAKKAINEMGNLNNAQKDTALKAVVNATPESAVVKVQNTAQTTDDNMSDLSTDANFKNADDIKNSSNYVNADKNLKDAYDKAVENAKALLDKINGSSTGDVSTESAVVKAAKQAVDEALNALNGDSNLSKAKEAAKSAIDGMSNLSDADKTAAKANVDKATNISGVNTAKTDAQNLNDAKKAAKDAIDEMGNLNKAQKQAAIDAVNNAQTKDAIQPIVDNATNLDGKMGDLKKAIEEANAKKSTTAYTQASDTKDFDKALNDADTLNSDNGDNEDADAVQKKIDALNNAKLDGEDQLANAKKNAIDAINKLNNLNKAQKQAAIDAVNNAQTKDAIQPIVDNATNLDGKMGDLKKAIEEANAKKSTTAYTQASDTKDFDKALNDADTLNSDNGDNEDADAVQKKIDALNNAKLDGEKQLEDAKNDAIDKINALNNLNKAQKDAAIEQVKNAQTKDAIQTIKGTATTLDGKMGDLKKAIDEANAKKSTTAYTQASDTKDFDEALNNANTLDSDNGDNEDADAVQKKIDALNNAKLDGEDQLANAKKNAIDAINKLNNLNKAQKQAAIDAVNKANTIAEIKPIVDNATNLDGKMGDLKKAIEEANAKKLTTAYTQASDTKNFDEALNNANTLNSDNGDNEDADAVQKKIDALNNAKLDGEDQLANAKKDAIDAINKLNNLNKAQKQAAIDAVNKANTIAEIKPIVDNATNLDGKMGDLKKAIEEANAKKSTTAYTQASDTKDFDKALNDADTLNSDNGDNEDADAVQKKIDALNNAKLDGEDQLANAKKDAIDAINKLNNLNKAQKQAAIDAVNKANTIAEIKPIVDNATNLEGKMGDLKKAIEEANAKKSTTAYTQASDTKDFDKALNDANTLNSNNGDNEDADAVQKKIDALNNAKLDGEKVALQKAIEQANAKIDGTNPDYVYYNSDSESQSALKDAVAKAKTLLEQRDASDDDFKVAREAIETAIKALNGQLTDKSALQKAASQSNDVHKSVVFLNASEAAKKAYEDALANAQTVLADENASQEDVDAALAKLNAALNKLDGKEAPAKPTVKKNTVKLGTNADRLPQTGSHKSVASELGLGILALGLTALGLAKKRKED